MNILYIPLDERPCNYKYPGQLVNNISQVNIIEPPKDILNKKKSPGDIEAIWSFVESNIINCEYAILSMDMLIYGGLLPSRLHKEPIEVLTERVNRLKKLRELNTKVKIYGFDLIMRIPSYSSSEEEPDYYDSYGETIFNISWLKDKIDRGHADHDDKKKYEELINKIPKEFYEDYFGRREKNYEVTKQILQLVKDQVFDYFVIPQDDSALYGVQSQEQGKHRKTIKDLGIINKVLMYPGADEVGCTLLGRVLNDHYGNKPKVYVRFSSLLGPTIIPKYEDRPYMETIKSHIISSGMLLCDNSLEADLILMVNTPGVEMQESWQQNDVVRTNYSHRNLNEFVLSAKDFINQNKKVIIADVAYSNGSDLELIELLVSEEIVDKLAAYGGWNTNGNTLGTVLAAGIVSFYSGFNKEFMIYRLIEDCGYQALVRQKVIEKLPLEGLGYYDFKDKTHWVEEKTEQLLKEFVSKNLQRGFREKISIIKASFPWSRMFEVDLEIEIK